MTQKLSRWWAVLLAMFLSLVSPITGAIARFFHGPSNTSSEATSATAGDALAASALAFTILPAPTGPPAGPLAGPEDVFINGMLVRDSLAGLVQSSAVSSASFLGGVGYTPEMYMRVTLAVPSNTAFVRGIAVSNGGEVHIYDASNGLPGGVSFIGGFPITNAGQLCVAFV